MTYGDQQMNPPDSQTHLLLQESRGLFLDYADEITERMYEIMFKKFPETEELFNPFRKVQPRKFAAAIMAHIISKEDLDVLISFRVGIARSHVKAGVKSEHYSMMAHSLTAALKDVLGNRIFEEILNAWHTWFMYLARLLIEREKLHYDGSHLLYPEEI